ncbi:hypothetical protein ASD24_24430 [Paenibacillus sp. Root52]|uniref:hypothetical protein n=1 Tax=Paenibacillus sp. Root52 TaxID=1736552 RepID=UPI0006FFE3C2|nr:hypothetical protein [Paenibacillus sp. Root52]KQY90947.1 hypothetical protein ASD24_24430 [Paenibacillus sp. Root52]
MQVVSGEQVLIGDVVITLLVQHGMVLDDLSMRTGMSNDDLVPFLMGEVEVTQEFADKLATILGPPAEYWIELDRGYRETNLEG